MNLPLTHHPQAALDAIGNFADIPARIANGTTAANLANNIAQMRDLLNLVTP